MVEERVAVGDVPGQRRGLRADCIGTFINGSSFLHFEFYLTLLIGSLSVPAELYGLPVMCLGD
jgi:hypothetical protein